MSYIAYIVVFSYSFIQKMTLLKDLGLKSTPNVLWVKVNRVVEYLHLFICVFAPFHFYYYLLKFDTEHGVTFRCVKQPNSYNRS